MHASSPSQVAVGEDVLLDGRLALFHKRERRLAVADLHFGYELSQRAVGNLFPFWGMQTIEERLEELLREYNPARLIILGDLVHNRAAAREATHLVKRLSSYCNILPIAGNMITSSAMWLIWLIHGQRSDFIFIMAIARSIARTASKSSVIIIRRERSLTARDCD
jgi:hypothetical protein